MTSVDLSTVSAIAALAHPSFPEDAIVFAERLMLYPQGCHVFDRDGVLGGYVLSHPWGDTPPALNTMLHALPAAPATYYIHDLALLPSARGSKAGTAIVTCLIDHARQVGFTAVSLVAVNNSEPFWQKLGFHRVIDERLHEKLNSYGSDAVLMRAQT